MILLFTYIVTSIVFEHCIAEVCALRMSRLALSNFKPKPTFVTSINSTSCCDISTVTILCSVVLPCPVEIIW